MNRADFLEALSQALAGLPERDRQEALNYFEELIADISEEKGLSEAEAITGLGPVEQIAASIRQASSQPPAQETSPRAQAGSAPDGSYGLKVVTAKASAVRAVTIQSANTSVTLLPGRGDEVELTYTQDERDIYDFSLEGGELRLIRRPLEGFNILDFLRFGRPTPEIILKVPADFAASCDLKTSNAAIDISDITFWGRLKARTANSGIRLERVQSQSDVLLRTSNSGIRLNKVSAKGEVEAQTSNSKLCALTVRAQRVTLITSNGRLTAEDVSSEGAVTLQTSNSRLEAVRVTAPLTLSLQTSNGGLSFSGLSSPDISLRTSNARVSGSVGGRAEDYSVTSRNSNGKDGLKNHRHQGPKRLDVQTSNGSIQVDFEG